MQLQRRRLAPSEIDHELLWLIISLATSLGLSAWLAARLPTPQCVFHSITGHPCVTCGATRAAWQLFHGHFATSFFLNPLAFTVYIAFALFDLYAILVLVTGARRLRFANFTSGERALGRSAAVALLLGNWLYLVVARPF